MIYLFEVQIYGEEKVFSSITFKKGYEKLQEVLKTREKKAVVEYRPMKKLIDKSGSFGEELEPEDHPICFSYTIRKIELL